MPVALGLMDRSVALLQGRMTDAATNRILAKSRGKKTATARPGLARITVSSPVLVDYAILGPDKSSPLRHW